LESGRCRATFHVDRGFDQCALSSDGRYAIGRSRAWEEPGTWLWWDLEAGQRRRVFVEPGERIRAVALSPDGLSAVLGGDEGSVRWWDLGADRCRAVLGRHVKGVDSIAISPDGHTVLTGGMDRTVRWWDLESGRCRTELPCDYSVGSVSFHRDGQFA